MIAGLTVDHQSPREKLFECPIVLVHGMLSTAKVFHPLMETLVQGGYECYAITLRGHGDSMPVDDLGKVSIKDYIDDVERVLKTLDNAVILIGHSMGAIVTSKVAEMNKGGLVLGHVSMTSAPPLGVIMGSGMIRRLPRYLSSILAGEAFSMTYDDAMALLFNTMSPEDAEQAFYEMTPESGTVAREIMFWKHRLKRLHCKALHIGARFDKITPHQRIIARMLGADYKEVNSGHMLTRGSDNITVANVVDTWISWTFPGGFVRS